MQLDHHRPNPRLLASVVAVLVALGLAACGDSDDDAGQAAAESSADTAAQGSDREQLDTLLAEVQDAFKRGQAERYCGMLTKSGQKEASQLTIPFSKTCQVAVRKATRLNIAGGVVQKPTRMLKATVRGNRAKLKVSDNERPPIFMLAAKENGEWKLASIGLNPLPKK